MKQKFLLGLALAVVLGVLAVSTAATAGTLSVCPSGCSYSTIQSAINAAFSGDTVFVGSGTYVENVVIDKPLTLRGAKQNAVIIVPAISNPNPCAGSSLCGGTASNIILVQADNVTLEKLTLDGDNPNLTSGIVRGGADVDARNGIITNYLLSGVASNSLIVSNVTVRNIYLRGIYAASGGSFQFENNVVTNVQGDAYSIGIFNYEGAGVMQDNKVSFTNDAISSNWSSGVQFLGNKISHSASGVHTDNAGISAPDLIKDNKVEDCLPDGYGIWVFVPYVAPTVQDNAVEGCSVGLAAFGQGAAVTTQFIHNEVSRNGALSSKPASSIGVIVTTDILGYGYTDVSALFTNNEITKFNTGVYVEKHGELFQFKEGGGGQATATFHNNIIEKNKTGANGMPDTDVNAENNWWGCAAGPNQPGCDTAIGTVDFTPWLTQEPHL
ncbi:MAG: nitrous oxide reductase family maturation protein NosD [Chloroflexota bacterium]